MASKIVVLGTGGTIAGGSSRVGDDVGYRAGERSVQSLLEAIGAHLLGTCELVAQEIAQIDSKDADCSLWSTLASRCRELAQDPEVAGLVIAHGTDTLEESAWLLSQVVPAIKPIVLTCAMRPATALTADGPQNLLDALALANDGCAVGVSVVCAGKVLSPEQVRKVHPYRMDAMGSGDVGPLGWMEEGRLRLASCWPMPAGSLSHRTLRLPVQSDEWPWVEIVQSHAGAREGAVDALVNAGVQGIVVSATGNGTLHYVLEAALRAAQGRGVAVRVASRCAEGAIVGTPAHGLALAPSGLSPVKARISLMLDLLEDQEVRLLD